MKDANWIPGEAQGDPGEAQGVKGNVSQKTFF
jgi:hypothetical protein